ncbi:LytR cell envelope-related transcriptional attenuator [Saccharopolyspora erythraea NRRL 2338]|uniref:Possible glycoprotein n=2 Tax=Saccharopolyspora erythraea TaxID=1836 RepID=A4F738_SACEN|nr:LytR C-terminal domain-containing protein [Saccharopolyspora erythraea]EQD82876.1 glycoprotein [Saccharopolyspora erythraea D]PFG93664.1 LytR cell envelope-related transcriptional attenuator [Saccharopolyspora erythraea NRRL 2338]QRK90512.1 LytR C-terminal domain-containing protein [Saccharopolyspora erythraea]CAL99862.1 possible glycoprotein [Saccharopolyspora erythraea NRRL 2338]
MTTGEPSSGPSRTKLAGFGLIGVGVVAAVVGVSTAVSGDPRDTAQQTPPADPPVASSVQNPPPVPPQEPPAPSTPAPPPAPSTQPQSPPPLPPAQETQPPKPSPEVPGDVAQVRIVVRVYNNSTIAGLAHRASEDFRRAGYDVPEVGNYSAGRIYTTTVYFRPGTEEEQQAKVVASQFGARMEPRFPGIETASPGVIAIVTNDYKGPAQGK